MQNRWGDPLLVHDRSPLSRIALAAFVAAVVAVVSGTLPFVLPADEYGRPGSGPEVVVLLVVLQTGGTAAGLALAYIALLAFPISDFRPGRGLAWAALAISYASSLWLLAILAAMLPVLGWLLVAAVIVGVLHIPAFAAESPFAKQAVTFVFIGGTFFSLVSCALLHSREDARIRQCQNNLREMGTNLMLASELHVDLHSSPRVENDELARLLQQVLDEAQKSDAVRGASGE